MRGLINVVTDNVPPPSFSVCVSISLYLSLSFSLFPHRPLFAIKEFFSSLQERNETRYERVCLVTRFPRTSMKRRKTVASDRRSWGTCQKKKMAARPPGSITPNALPTFVISTISLIHCFNYRGFIHPSSLAELHFSQLAILVRSHYYSIIECFVTIPVDSRIS